MIRYLLISSAYLSVFYLLYLLLFSNDTRYRRNRIYLLSSLVISAVLPLIKIDPVTNSFLHSLSQNFSGIISLGEVSVFGGSSDVSVHEGLFTPLMIYLVGCIIATTLLVFRISNIIRLITRYRIKGTRLVLIPSSGQRGFSALGYIFISNELDSETRTTIKQHELNHIRNKHSFDIILIRIFAVFFWFNPFIYLVDRSLKAVHEFEADEKMLDSGQNIISYQKLILNQLFNTSIFTLENGFSGRSLIKKRMIMMTKTKTKKVSGLKLLIALPAILAAFIIFSCTSEEISPLENIDEPVSMDTKDAMQDLALNTEKLSVIKEDDENLKSKDTSFGKKVFIVVEEMPTFRGGDVNKFREWVQRNVQYPEIAAKNGIEGKVFVMFIVDENGHIRQPEIMRGVDPVLDKEVIETVKLSPVWVAGKQRGKNVPVRFAITVNFQLR